MRLLVLQSFSILVSAVAAFAAPAPSLRIVLAPAPSEADCKNPGQWMKSAPLGEVLFDETDIEAYREADHAFVINAKGMARLFSNAAAFTAEPESVTPAGTLFAMAGRGFVVMLGNTRLVGGAITTMQQLRETPPCPQLYPLFSSLIAEPLALSIGTMRTHEELGEDPWKVVMEEGQVGVYIPQVPRQVIDYLRKAGKIAKKR